MSAVMMGPGALRAAAGVYRREWWRLAVILLVSGAAAFLAVGLVALGLGTLGPSLGVSAQNPVMQVATIVLLQVGIALPWLAGMAAMVGMSKRVLDGERPRAARSLANGLAQSPLLALGLLGYALALVAAMVASSLLVKVWVFLVPVALVGLMAWWLVPALRSAWLRWLIVLCAPFGLLAYTAVSLALWLPAMVLENTGPIRGLRTSARLSRGRHLELGLAGAASLLALVIAAIPVCLAVLGVASRLGGDAAGAPSAAVGTGLTLVLFGGLPVLVLTLMYARLRVSRPA